LPEQHFAKRLHARRLSLVAWSPSPRI
jgi:hypothetical protein